jgi:hypothetical protein
MVVLLLVYELAIGYADERAAAGLVVPLVHTHAHNDYEHKRPLFDALDHGFCSVEADVFLERDQLLVGHATQDLRPERTLKKLYLDPLRERVRANNGRVYRDGPTVYLLIDVKTEATATYRTVDKVLARYADIVSVVDHGKFEPKAVTVVISGNRAPEMLAAQTVRYAGLDGRLTDLDSKIPAHEMPWISDRWSAHFRWQGEGPMPAAERAKLRQLVQKVHEHGRLLRFWATPELPSVWRELRSAGVDLINTDKLAELQQFLLEMRR